MIIHNCMQGSDEWLMLRLGLPTASQFNQFVSAIGKYREGKMPKSYMAQLIAEDIVTADFDDYSSTWMERGNALEAEAIAEYEIDHNVTCQRVGCIENDGAICSPDALVGNEGLLEVKCPMAKTLILHLMGGDQVVPADYIVQAHGQLVVSGRQWIDLKIYHPEIDKALEIHTERNEFTQQVAEHLARFKTDLAATREGLGL